MVRSVNHDMVVKWTASRMRYTIIGKEAGNWRLQRRKIVPLDEIHRIAYSEKLEEQIMLIEKIFKEIYSKMQNETGTDDLAMSDRLSVLLETPIEELIKKGWNCCCVVLRLSARAGIYKRFSILYQTVSRIVGIKAENMMKNMGYDEFKKKILSLVAEKLGKTIKQTSFRLIRKIASKMQSGLMTA